MLGDGCRGGVMSCWEEHRRRMGRNPGSSSAAAVWFGPCSNIPNQPLYTQITDRLFHSSNTKMNCCL